jgi:trk system potassium uptake protein TrkH
MLPPMVINIIFSEHIWAPFIIPFVLIILTGGSTWFMFKDEKLRLTIREGFLIVVLTWIAVCLFASLPFLLCAQIKTTLTDAIFETVSGITTTGAECFNNLQDLPHSILYYHQQLQFIGGMGIVVLAVAIFPMLGMGGMELFKVEASSPFKDNKLTPRIAQTAKSLWVIYCFMTIMCAMCYWYAGLDWFHALGESFGTISTGGLPMYDNGFIAYHNQYIQGIACVFMLISAVSFTLHYLAFQQRSITVYWKNEEFRTLFKIVVGVIVVILGLLITPQFTEKNSLSTFDVIFIIISAITSTGITFASIDNLPLFAPILIIFISMIGGCAGSTTGGLKILRLLLMLKHGKNEFIRALHPQAILTIKLNKQTVHQPILQSIFAYAVIYFGIFVLFILLFMACNNDFITSFSAAACGVANASVSAIGAIKDSFASLNNPSKWLLIIAMLTGRLEIFPLFILFTRAFWQK